MMAMADEAAQVLADLDELRSGRLAIGASATVAETWLPELLGRFHQRYPELALEVRTGNSEAVVQMVREGEVGLAVVGRAPDDPKLSIRPVAEDRIELFGPADRWRERHVARLADLAGESFVVREPGSATREAMAACFEAHGFRPASEVILGSNEAVKRAVQAGLGVGALSALAVEGDIDTGAFAAVRPHDWDCRRRFWLVGRRDRLPSRAERAALELLR
jgi:DNA-binding transcriptional LysR family regulator